MNGSDQYERFSLQKGRVFSNTIIRLLGDMRQSEILANEWNSITFGDAYLLMQCSFVLVPFLEPPLQIGHTRAPTNF